MAGILYVILMILTGRELVNVFLPPENQSGGRRGSRFLVVLVGAFGVGALTYGWGTYMLSWAASTLGAGEPLFWGNLVMMSFGTGILMFLYGKRYKKNHQRLKETSMKELLRSSGFSQISGKEKIFFGILLVFITWIMFYVFYVYKDALYMGYTVYGDYAPHTAMMRSFSRGNNFPTEYPHFGGQDVKYHFMFQFLTGNLEYLGLRIDLAYNLLSILALWGFLVLLYLLAVRVTDSRKAGALGIFLFFFRSGTAFFQFLWEHIHAGDLIETLKANTSFIGYTTNENWGLWNFNVYLNQRHLAFGLLLVTLVFWFYMDWIEAGASHPERGLLWIRNRFLTKEAWKVRNPESALLAGMFLGLAAFWNGAAVIGGLLILAGFALFSDGKLDYLITAVTAVAFSVLQTRIFIWGSAVDTTFYWGFLSEDKSLKGVLLYLLQMSGIYFLGALVLLIFLKKRTERMVLFSCFLPVVFTFTISMTPDIAVNHKYLMIAYAFLTMFWGLAILKFFRKKIPGRILAVVLTLCLTVTGVYDFVIILRNNGPGRRVFVNLDSTLTDWLCENLDHEDLILTPEYSINEVTMSGVMLYMGWPYYAWSAGYDTYGRAEKAKTIYSSTDKEQIKELVKEEKITYILYEEDMEYEGMECREDMIAATFPLVYQSDDRRIRIYETQ